MATIRELVGRIHVAPQYSRKEADLLVEEYHERTKLEGEAIDHDVKAYGIGDINFGLYQSVPIKNLKTWSRWGGQADYLDQQYLDRQG